MGFRGVCIKVEGLWLRDSRWMIRVEGLGFGITKPYTLFRGLVRDILSRWGELV